jgi:hypothetical protein
MPGEARGLARHDARMEPAPAGAHDSARTARPHRLSVRPPGAGPTSAPAHPEPSDASETDAARLLALARMATGVVRRARHDRGSALESADEAV